MSAGQLGASLCTCGHVGDGSIVGHLAGRPTLPLQHGGALGHGLCLVHNCPCTKFTWLRRLTVADQEAHARARGSRKARLFEREARR